MDVQVKVVALICLAIMFCVALALGYDEPQMWASILGLMSLIVGGGTAIKSTVDYLIRR